ncbi:MAG: hypothetical protein KGL69_04150 [Alphaproteobacteria bacterium]|nr:hypothetical protein [Alphaproteobacteria bacterium]
MIPAPYAPHAPAKTERRSLVSLQGALLTINVLFVVLAALTLAAGLASLMLSRALDRAKDREIASLRLQAAETTAQAAHQMAQVEAQLLTFLSGPAAARLPAPAQGDSTSALAAGAAAIRAALQPGAPPSIQPAAAAPPATATAVFAPHPMESPPPVGASRPHRLSAQQVERMVAILKLAPSMIMITTDGRPDSESFADDLQTVFARAGWHVDRAVYASLNKPLAPLAANLKGTPVDVAVRGAFAAAGLALPARDPNAASADREVFVGSTLP